MLYNLLMLSNLSMFLMCNVLNKYVTEESSVNHGQRRDRRVLLIPGTEKRPKRSFQKELKMKFKKKG
uniref:Uncharacterized protein n=1 Tax=Arion vulgaris TaxID=1028688 RepID=A0A0B6ZMW4_9EUPU